MSKELAVIIDQEARKNLENLHFRWFFSGEKRRDALYLLETPLGNQVEVEGTLVPHHLLNEHAAEYLYLELTPVCHFNCQHCGIKGDLARPSNYHLIDESAPYLTLDFTSRLADALQTNPITAHPRYLFLGGGEPLIAPHQFAALNSTLSRLERTLHIVTTNGCPLPLDENRFAEFMQEIGSPHLLFSCSPSHLAQYFKLAKEAQFPDYIPSPPDLHQALYEKARIIESYCRKLNIGFSVNVVENGDRLTKDLRSYILRSAARDPVFTTEINGRRPPCSQGQELSIRSNGRLYPHCYDIFNGTYYIGLIGLLVK